MVIDGDGQRNNPLHSVQMSIRDQSLAAILFSLAVPSSPTLKQVVGFHTFEIF